ncbi:MAG: phosphate acyltransferase PlsX [Firmicutes bacterium]|nr:phosphate acyltransferase PlsX [Bacillota bacterium]
MHIIADVFGGDKPQEILYGVTLALLEDTELKITITGDEHRIKELIANDKRTAKKTLPLISEGRLIILHARDTITNDDAPVAAIKNKKESSLVKAFDLLTSSDDYAGMFSSGNTGAILAGGVFKIGRIKGVSRPTLCGILPTANEGQGVAIADIGANVDCIPVYLGQFARMASIYMNGVYGVENPRVGLLSVGTEDKKGDELTHGAFEILKADNTINFVGNMEARDTMSGDFDIIVADGFSGNVLLKGVEGTGKLVSGILKNDVFSGIRGKLGAIMVMRGIKRLKRKMNYHSFGGASLLGLKKILVKAHGSCSSLAVQVIIRQITKMHKNDVVNKISVAMQPSEK